MPQQGVPVDQATGRVFPNPKNIKPVLDTEIKSTRGTLRLPKGVKAVAEPYRGGATPSIDKAPLKNPIVPSPIRSFKKGTKRVPKTGVYKLHKNEAVIPAKKAAKMRRAQTALGHK